jgi:hypothetical protein
MARMVGHTLLHAADEGFALFRTHGEDMIAHALESDASPKAVAQTAEKDAAQEQNAGGLQVIQTAYPHEVRHDGVPEQHDDQAEQGE